MSSNSSDDNVYSGPVYRERHVQGIRPAGEEEELSRAGGNAGAALR